MSSVFTRAQWAAAAATFATLGAMFLYPGGTSHDHATAGYDITHNFLSDLGMTVAYDGRPNRAGAALFIASVGMLVIGLGGALVGFVRMYTTDQRARHYAWAAALTGVIACVAFTGVALTPENSAMSWHVAFTLAGFRILPVVALLITLAANATPNLPRSVVPVWAALTAVLAAYAFMLNGGAWASTPSGFVAQVVAQKLVSIIWLGGVVWQTRVADALTSRRPTSREPVIRT